MTKPQSEWDWRPVSTLLDWLKAPQVSVVFMPLSRSCSALIRPPYVRVKKGVAMECLASFEPQVLYLSRLEGNTTLWLGGADPSETEG